MDVVTGALTHPGSGSVELLVWALLWVPITGFTVWMARWAVRSWRLSPRDLHGLEERNTPAGAAGSESRDRFRAARRGLGPMAVLLSGVCGFAWSILIDRVAQGWVAFRSGVAYSDGAEVAVLVFLCVTLFGAMAAASVYWFARPTALLPPQMRDDPGLFHARRLRAKGVEVDALYGASAAGGEQRGGR